MELSEAVQRLPSLRLTVETHGLLADKSLGQNFLLDQNITDKIIRASLQTQNRPDFSDSDVFEIGPGPGGLTRAILKAEPRSLTAVEMDSRCLNILSELQDLSAGRLTLIQGDALRQDLGAAPGQNKQIISNLPYNISVPLLTGWLHQIVSFQALTLMFQKEVADRITAPVGTKTYCRLSVLAQLLCRIDRLLDLNPACFVPAPKIWSTVLLFRPLAERPAAERLHKVEKLTALAFGQRRKMIRQSLKSIPDLAGKAEQAGISLTARPEEITPGRFLAFADLC